MPARFFKLTALLALVCAWPVSASSLSLFAVGEARAADSAELLYTEEHLCREDRLLCEVRYSDAQGDLLATKLLDYRRSAIAPEVRLRDLRAQEALELVPHKESLHVVDAGFDNFVRSRWASLIDGDRVTFDFQPLGFDRPLAMRAQATDDAAGGEVCDNAQLCLKVRVDSWLLGLVAEPLQLVYSRKTRQLLRYVGVSNLRNARGETPVVDIHYRYPDPDSEARML